MDLAEEFKEKAKKKGGRVVLPESGDKRILKAAEKLSQEGICDVILIGDEQELQEKATQEGIYLKGVNCVSPSNSVNLDDFADVYSQLRKISRDDAEEQIKEPLNWAAMMVRMDKAEAVVAGAAHPTGEVLKTGFRIIEMAPNYSVVSSSFIMILPEFRGEKNKPFIFADCAVVPQPNARQLASIAIASADTMEKLLGKEPIVGLLSFSTKGSSDHREVEKVREALKLIKRQDKDLKVDGEFQVDAAVIPEIGESKAPDSSIAGEVNCLIFPDLDAGNIGYKLTQRFAGAEAIGPIIQGLNKPMNDLSRGCSVEDVVNVSAISLLTA